MLAFTRRCCSLLVVIVLAVRSSAHDVVEKEWPFYTPQGMEPPTPKRSDWIRNPIDAFVLQKLEDNHLSPSPKATRTTLVRRLYFDLIGLPPTPEQVDAFVSDQDPQAYEKVVDRLLDDSRYGERWARFWLDLARYADTAGYEGDPDMPHAWRYRDYVIDSLNRDKPYDRFIKEQIAGDEFDEIMGAGELPNVSAENTVALTFLRLAPFTEPRGDETRHEMLSEITSTVGSVFLGLTVGCAKCHDHKHDEIPTADFYRMKAFFATIQIPPPERGDAYQIGGPLPAEFYRKGEKEQVQNKRKQLESELANAESEIATLKKQIAKRIGKSTSGSAGFGIQTITSKGNDYFFERKAVSDGKIHDSVVSSSDGKWIVRSDGSPASELGTLSGDNRGIWFNALQDAQHISLGRHTAGTGKPAEGGHEGKFAEILIYDSPLTDMQHKQLAEYTQAKFEVVGTTQPPPPQTGLQFWLDASDLDANPNTPNPNTGDQVAVWVDKIGQLRLTQSKLDLQPTLSSIGAAQAPALDFSNDFLSGSVTGARFLKNPIGSIVVVYSATHQTEGYGFEIGGNGQFLSTFVNPSAGKSKDPIADLINSNSHLVTPAERRRFQYLSTRDRFVKQHLKRLTAKAMSLRHSFGPPYEPGVPTSRIMVRGEYDHPGEVVEPGFLSVITGHQKPATIRLDPFKRWPTRSRRMALANWIASPKNPMTHRVMVNRLWHWHFGQGIVKTPSDFGYLSDGPSHQELLDWLALQFVQNKWSIKSMHRLIVNSATYRQSSRHANPRAQELDPDNRWLWKFNRRRLDAEAIRDSILSVSGRLNPEQFGIPIFPPLPGDIADTVKYSVSKWDTQYGAEGRKRSIYIYQQRTLTMPFFQTFDALVCDESRPRRPTSVTPLQALAMYNGEFVNEESKYFADRVRKHADNDSTWQIRTAFRIAFGREPSPHESAKLASFLKQYDSHRDAVIGLCRVLYNSNEFMYID